MSKTALLTYQAKTARFGRSVEWVCELEFFLDSTERRTQRPPEQRKTKAKDVLLNTLDKFDDLIMETACGLHNVRLSDAISQRIKQAKLNRQSLHSRHTKAACDKA